MLGAALEARAEEVCATFDILSASLFDSTAPAVRKLTHTSTVWVARWIGGASPDSAKDALDSVSLLFGNVAAGETPTSLGDLFKGCLRWRDALVGILLEEAARQGTSPAGVERALTMARQSLDATLITIAHHFDGERHRLLDALEEERAQARYDAQHDQLTTLGNRRALMDDLAAGVSNTPDGRLALGVLDLDGFKLYNDTHGHTAGDDLLASLGRRLAAAVAEHGTAYRLGGDEFCIIIRAEDPADVLASAVAALSTSTGGIWITCSAGWVSIPKEASSPEAALSMADTRMYLRKAAPRGFPPRLEATGT